MIRNGGPLRFAWTSSDRLGWCQFPLRPTRRPAWLDPSAGLACALVGGLLWRSWDPAPFAARAAGIGAWFVVVGYAWFHFRQLAMRRVPSATLWPAAIVAILVLRVLLGW